MLVSPWATQSLSRPAAEMFTAYVASNSRVAAVALERVRALAARQIPRDQALAAIARPRRPPIRRHVQAEHVVVAMERVRALAA